jgi:hypothetical protein
MLGVVHRGKLATIEEEHFGEAASLLHLVKRQVLLSLLTRVVDLLIRKPAEVVQVRNGLYSLWEIGFVTAMRTPLS